MTLLAPVAGVCHDGKCTCAIGFSGEDCSKRCGVDGLCSRHGRCVNGTLCFCDPGWTGDACEMRSCLLDCSGNGVCRNGTCACLGGYSGQDCATTMPTKHDCAVGCVHICAERCASETEAAARSRAALGGLANGAAVTESCFSECRKTCVSRCGARNAASRRLSVLDGGWGVGDAGHVANGGGVANVVGESGHGEERPALPSNAASSIGFLHAPGWVHS